MNFLQKINPEWPLRLGLGIMYLYSGYDLFYHPMSWFWAVPKWFAQIVTFVAPLEMYLRFQGIAEFIIGLLFLAWFVGRWGIKIASILTAVEMAGILFFTGIDSITFRDLGLLGAAITLIIFSAQKENGTIAKN